LLEERLTAMAIRTVSSREPGGTPLGERLRNLLLDPASGEICPDAELLLMFAARAEHLERVIRPALERGCWVLCDRFTDATYAYQGAGRGIAGSRVGQIEEWVQGPLRPDLVVLLDLPVEVGLTRVKTRHGSEDRFERQGGRFLETVREAYLERARTASGRYLVVEADRPSEVVQASIWQAIRRRYAGLLETRRT